MGDRNKREAMREIKALEKRIFSGNLSLTMQDQLYFEEERNKILHKYGLSKKGKKKWSKREVLRLLKKFRLYALKFGLDENTFNKWVNENIEDG